MSIANAKSFSPNVEHGRIVTYRVSITGDGIAQPVTAEFDGGATEGVIDGVPVGSGREVAVVAVNPNGATIKAGEASNVDVDGGVTDVSIEMEQVPIFTNVHDGSVVDNSRFVLRVFADPRGAVVIDGGGEPVVDASTNTNEVAFDESSWLGAVAPATMPPGERTFVATDITTRRSSSVTVRLVEGGGRSPAPFAAAAQSGSDGTMILTDVTGR